MSRATWRGIAYALAVAVPLAVALVVVAAAMVHAAAVGAFAGLALLSALFGYGLVIGALTIGRAYAIGVRGIA